MMNIARLEVEFQPSIGAHTVNRIYIEISLYYCLEIRPGGRAGQADNGRNAEYVSLKLQ
jgi:hypothetical protein